MDRRKSYCMICGRQKEGIAIKEDPVIEVIKWYKANITRNVKNNRIVVCRECYPKYKKMRGRYESNQRLLMVLGALFFIFGIIISLSLTTIAFSMAVVAFLYLISLLLYMPALEVGGAEKMEKKAGKKLPP